MRIIVFKTNKFNQRAKKLSTKDQETEAIKLDQVTLKKLNSIQKLISEMFKMNYNRNLLTEEQIGRKSRKITE